MDDKSDDNGDVDCSEKRTDTHRKTCILETCLGIIPGLIMIMIRMAMVIIMVMAIVIKMHICEQWTSVPPKKYFKKAKLSTIPWTRRLRILKYLRRNR